MKNLGKMVATIAAVGLALSACGGNGGTGGEGGADAAAADADADGDAGDVAGGRGIDPDGRVIRVGALFDLSGPGASLGQPWHAALTTGVDALNESGRLGDWTVELDVRDHGWSPSEATALYEDLKDEVAMILPTFGSQTTTPLLPRFADDDMLAFVAGGASTNFTDHTIWGFTSFRTEAMRTVDHIVEVAGDDARLGLIYLDDDAGADMLDGFRTAAEELDATIVAEVGLEFTADDYAAPVGRLMDAGATHVLIGIAGAHPGGILGTATTMGYEPQWYGGFATFLEAVFYGALPPEIWEDRFLWVHGLPYWGEDRPGMQEFVDAYEASDAAGQFPGPQVFALLGHLQLQMAAEILAGAIEAGDLTSEGIFESARSVTDFDADGLLLGPTRLLAEGEATTVTRVLAPDVAGRTWEVVGDAKTLDW